MLCHRLHKAISLVKGDDRERRQTSPAHELIENLKFGDITDPPLTASLPATSSVRVDDSRRATLMGPTGAIA